MPNAIKYNVSAETLALNKGNFWIGNGSVGKGPTSITGYYNGITPPSGGYTIYLNKETGGPSIYTVSNDAQLISLTNSIAVQSYTTANECLVYFAGQTDKMVLNRNYEGIVTDGLVFNVDAGFTPSYPKSGTTIYDLSGNGNNGAIYNGPSYSTDGGGCLVFDGTNDYANCGNNASVTNITEGLTLEAWIIITSQPPGDAVGIIDTQSGGDYGYRLCVEQSVIEFGVYAVQIGKGYTELNGRTSVISNDWKYIVGTWDGYNMKVYVNGVQDNTAVQTGLAPSSQNLYFGVRDVSSGFFPGKIAISRIYNRGLSADEVLQNYNAQKGRFGL
jgi:hypothetical protein